MKKSPLVLVTLCSLLTACPGEEPFSLFAEVHWQVRCNIAGGCILPSPRSVSGGDGDDGFRLSCSASKSGSDTILTFRATRSTDVAWEIRNLVIPASGGAIGGASCEVVIVDEGNTYRGACGPEVPSGGCLEDPDTTTDPCNQPCRIYDVSIASGEPSSIVGKLYCQGLPLTADPKRVIELTNSEPSGSGTQAPNFPVSFRIDACSGV